MTRDEIIDAYQKVNGWSPKGFEKTVDELERFAAIIEVHVAAREQEKLKQEREQCAGWLEEAAEDIESWGAYASEYFQQKHSLDKNVQDYRDRAAGIRARENNE